jgi:hypothetical protein
LLVLGAANPAGLTAGLLEAAGGTGLAPDAGPGSFRRRRERREPGAGPKVTPLSGDPEPGVLDEDPAELKPDLSSAIEASLARERDREHLLMAEVQATGSPKSFEIWVS